jgi:hypothetical protein
VPAREGRTVAELLDDSDGLAREALLDMSPDRALGMVRGWPQLMQSAAELWAVHPPDPTASVNGDPIAILAAMGRAVGRSFAAGHWPGLGPAWEQIGSNFVHARRLLEQQPCGISSCINRRPDRLSHSQNPDIARDICRSTRHRRRPDRVSA